MDTLSLGLTKQPSSRFKQKLPNNAYFMNFRQYQAKQTVFGEEWRTQFGGDLRAYIVTSAINIPFFNRNEKSRKRFDLIICSKIGF